MTFEEWWEGGHRGLLAERECRELWDAACLAGLKRAAEICDRQADAHLADYETEHDTARLVKAEVAEGLCKAIMFHAASRTAENPDATD